MLMIIQDRCSVIRTCIWSTLERSFVSYACFVDRVIDANECQNNIKIYIRL